MPIFKNKQETFNQCKISGFLIPLDKIDTKKIKSNLKIAEEDFASAKDILKKKRWNSTYKIHYDVLHGLVEALLRFGKVKSSNHQCLFAYLCVKHPELELDWNFFEKVRTKRNGINYYAIPVSEKDWKEIGLQMNLYIKLLKKTIEIKIQELDD